jgi:surfeit locus 1 family protein
VNRARAFAAALALLAAALAGLGVWQVERRAWKHRLIATTEARLAAAPIDLPPRSRWPALAQDGAYLKVRLVGRWLPGRSAFVQAVTDLGPGWWVVQGLATQEGTVLVNRGFVPQDARARTSPAKGSARVSGLLRHDEPEGAFLRHNDPAADRWYSRDTAAIARSRGWGQPAPFFVDADRPSSPAFPRGGLTVVRFADNHLIYALTWFTLGGMALWFAWRIACGRGVSQDQSP